MVKGLNKIVYVIVCLLFLNACGDESIPLPKPPTYLRLDLPGHDYVTYNDKCNYTFDISKLYLVKKVVDQTGETCHKDIDLGPLNGVVHFSYIDMVEPLAKYVNYSIDKVEEHKIKATAIEDTKFLRPKDRVFGTLFELQGNVASPFQFYLTDSTSRFVSGVVYFNAPPNYDSLKPSLEYLKVDIMRMLNSFQWKN